MMPCVVPTFRQPRQPRQPRHQPGWLARLALAAFALAGPGQVLADSVAHVSLQLKWHHQFQFAGYYAALDQGYYRDAGIDVDIREGGPNVSPTDAVAEGRADFGVGTSAVLLARARGARVVVLAQIFQHSPAILLLARPLASPSDWSALRQARLMDAPDSDDIAAMLQRHGVDYRAMPRVPHSGDPATIADGNADAMIGYSTNEPWYFAARGWPYGVLSPRDSGIDFYGDNLVVSQRLLEAQPEMVRRFRDATLRGWRFAMDHPEAVVDVILKRYPQGKNREALLFEATRTTPLVQSDLVDLGYQSMARWRAIAQTYQSLGAMPSAEVPAELVYEPGQQGLSPRLRNLLFGVAAGAALLVSVVAWIAVLNRQLRAQAARLRAAEDESARVTRQFLAMADALPVAAYHSHNHLDGRTSASFVAAQAESILGVPIDEIRHDPACRWRNVVPQDADVPRRVLTGAIERVHAGEKNVRLQILVRLQIDSQVRWVQSIAVASRVHADGSVEWNGYYEDVTERRLAEQALLQERQRLQATLDVAPVGVAILVDRIAVVANPRMRELVHLSGLAQESAFVDPATEDRLEAIVAAHGVARDVEAQAFGPNGQVRDVLATYLPFDYQGRAATLAWLVDVTPLKATQKALEQARLAAEQATRAKSHFLANMSHEIRTPLNALLGLTHLVLGMDLAPRQRDYLQRMNAAGATLLSLVDDVLDFSKIEADRVEIESIDFDLHEMLRGVVDVTAPAAHAKGLEYVVDVAGDVPRRLRGDPLRVRQVLVNLLSNAVKFTPHGEVVLRIERQPPDDDGPSGAQGPRLRFRISDTGVGIDPDIANRLFIPFNQADNSTTRRFGGTGLGLSISQRLARLMGGDITLRNTPGQGATFEFDACFDAPAAADAPVGARQSPVPRLAPERLAGLRVLVIDEHPGARRVLLDALARWGIAAEGCGDAADGLARIADAARPLDLVIVDAGLHRRPPTAGQPGTDVASWVEALRNAAPARPRLLALYPASDDRARESVERPGVDAVATKPVDTDVLCDVVERLFGDAPPQAAATAAPAAPRLDGCRVLLVEDNEVNRLIAREMLHGAGAAVTEALDGRQALDALDAAGPDAFDVVLMDVQMPVMGGYQATQAIRSQAPLRDLPVIAMTAHALGDERERCRSAGMDDYLTKPFDATRFLTLVALWASQGRARRNLSPLATPPVRLGPGAASPPAA